MNHRNTIGQGFLWMVVAVPLSFTGSEALSRVCLGMAIAGVICFGFLNMRYAIHLGKKPRSPYRARGDRIVASWALVYFAAVLALAGAASAGWLPHWTWNFHEAGIPVVLPALLYWAAEAMYLSNFFDWYWMRAWRDGVVTEPPCVRDAGADPRRWKNVTRWWILHRFIAAGSVFVALMVTGSYIWVHFQDEAAGQDWILYLLTILAPLPVVTVLMPGYLRPLLYSIRIWTSDVRPKLGDVVEVTLGDLNQQAMLHEVSLDQGLVFRTTSGTSLHQPFTEMLKFEPVHPEAGFVCSPTLCRSLDGIEYDHQPCEWGVERVSRESVRASHGGRTIVRELSERRPKVRNVPTPFRLFVY